MGVAMTGQIRHEGARVTGDGNTMRVGLRVGQEDT